MASSFLLRDRKWDIRRSMKSVMVSIKFWVGGVLEVDDSINKAGETSLSSQVTFLIQSS